MPWRGKDNPSLEVGALTLFAGFKPACQKQNWFEESDKDKIAMLNYENNDD